MYAVASEYNTANSLQSDVYGILIIESGNMFSSLLPTIINLTFDGKRETSLIASCVLDDEDDHHAPTDIKYLYDVFKLYFCLIVLCRSSDEGVKTEVSIQL